MTLGPLARPAGAPRPHAAAPAPAPRLDRGADEAALQESARALEGLFVQQLFQAMRANIPTDGLVERSAGEDLFSSMLDQRIADRVAAQESGPRDLSSSLFDALRQRLGPAADTAR